MKVRRLLADRMLHAHNASVPPEVRSHGLLEPAGPCVTLIEVALALAGLGLLFLFPFRNSVLAT